MARDTQKSVDEHKEQKLDEELKRFMDHLLDKPESDGGWLGKW
jgi:hypothetical protein